MYIPRDYAIWTHNKFPTTASLLLLNKRQPFVPNAIYPLSGLL